MLDAATICLEEFSDYLKNFNSLEGWEAPLGGVSLGHVRKAAGNSLHEILRTATQLTASFSSLQLAGDILETTDMVGKEDRWPKQIKDAVIRVAPDLDKYFDRKFDLFPGGTPTKYDFLGDRYVANFGKVNSPHSSLKDGRAKLWMLARLREAQLFAPTYKGYDLILWRPQEDSPDYSEKAIRQVNETILELTEEAKKEELGAIAVLGPEQASQHILQMEAA